MCFKCPSPLALSKVPYKLYKSSLISFSAEGYPSWGQEGAKIDVHKRKGSFYLIELSLDGNSDMKTMEFLFLPCTAELYFYLNWFGVLFQSL